MIREDEAQSCRNCNPPGGYQILHPSRLRHKKKVDAVANFRGSASLSGATVNSANITGRNLQVGVPAGTTPARWAQINKAIDYATSQGVTLDIAVLEP